MTFETTEQAILNEPERLCADALAELFLGETERGDQEPRAQAREAGATMPLRSLAPELELEGSPIATAAPQEQGPEPQAGRPIEAVLAGHLPILASAWVSQYARGMSHKGGAVGLVRAGGSHLSVEVFGEGAPRPQAPHTSAADAVAALRPTVSRWLIQADAALAGALLDHGEIDRLTLLCSADEASLVAGYRTLKEMLEPRIELQAPVSGPRLHIAIAGRADAEAMAAAERLSRAAERFLGIETTVAVGAARIESGASATWFEGEAATPGLLARLADIITEGTPAPEAAPIAQAGGGEAGDLDSGWPEIFGPAFDSSGFAAPEPLSDVVSTGVPGGALPHSNGLAVEASMPAREAPARSAAARGPLAIQCPRAPAIEFRIEDAGFVAIADARAQSIDLALHQLMVASAWAAENHALIAMATGQPGALAPPQRVLLVKDAVAARPLLDADIRVRVSAAGRDEIPLN